MDKKSLLTESHPGRVNVKQKPSIIDPKVIEDREYRCSCCGHKYQTQKGKFNKVKSPLFNGNNNYLTVCKKCVDQLFDQYTKFFSGDEDCAMERLCQLFDMPYDESAWGMTRRKNSDVSRVSVYISKLNLIGSTNGFETYSDTIARRYEAQVENAETFEAVASNPDIETPVSVVRRFGTGYTAGEYDSLQYEYDDWVDKYGLPIDKRQEELYVTISSMKLTLQKSIQSGSTNTGTIANSYRSLIEAATTEIEDRKKKAEEAARVEKKIEPIGMLIKDIENYCPAEFYKNKKIYKDSDGTGKYFSRYILRPLRNILTDSKDMDSEYNIGGSETDGDIDD